VRLHEGAHVGFALHESPALELLQRTAHDVPLRGERPHELVLDESFPRESQAEDDLLLQLLEQGQRAATSMTSGVGESVSHGRCARFHNRGQMSPFSPERLWIMGSIVADGVRDADDPTTGMTRGLPDYGDSGFSLFLRKAFI